MSINQYYPNKIIPSFSPVIAEQKEETKTLSLLDTIRQGALQNSLNPSPPEDSLLLSNIINLTPTTIQPFQSENPEDFFNNIPRSIPINETEKQSFLNFISKPDNYSYLQKILETTPLADHISFLELFELHFDKLISNIPPSFKHKKQEWIQQFLDKWIQQFLDIRLKLIRLIPHPGYYIDIPPEKADLWRIKMGQDVKKFLDNLKSQEPSLSSLYEEWDKTAELFSHFLSLSAAPSLLIRVPLTYFPNSEKLTPSTPEQLSQAVKNFQRLSRMATDSKLLNGSFALQKISVQLAIAQAFHEISQKLSPPSGQTIDWQKMKESLESKQTSLAELASSLPSNEEVEAQIHLELLLSLAIWRIEELHKITEKFLALKDKNYISQIAYRKRATVQLDLLIQQSEAQEKPAIPKELQSFSKALQAYFIHMKTPFDLAVKNEASDTANRLLFETIKPRLTPVLQSFIDTVKKISRGSARSLKDQPLIKNCSFFTQVLFLYGDIESYLGGGKTFEEMPPQCYLDFLALGSDFPKLEDLNVQENQEVGVLDTKSEDKASTSVSASSIPNSSANKKKKKKKKKKLVPSNPTSQSTPASPTNQEQQPTKQANIASQSASIQPTPPPSEPRPIDLPSIENSLPPSQPTTTLQDLLSSNVRQQPASIQVPPPPSESRPIVLTPIATLPPPSQPTTTQPARLSSTVTQRPAAEQKATQNTVRVSPPPLSQTAATSRSTTNTKPTSIQEVKESLQAVRDNRRNFIRYLKELLKTKETPGGRHIKIAGIPIPSGPELAPGTVNSIAKEVYEKLNRQQASQDPAKRSSDSETIDKKGKNQKKRS